MVIDMRLSSLENETFVFFSLYSMHYFISYCLLKYTCVNYMQGIAYILVHFIWVVWW